MTFSFRVRFHLAPGVRLSHSDEVWVLEDSSAENVVLKPCRRGTPFAEADEFSLRGRGYPDKDAAVRAAEVWSARIRLVFAANYVAADFGDRAARGAVTEFARSKLSEKIGAPILGDVHGVMVFQTEPTPILIRVDGAVGTVTQSDARIAACFESVKMMEVETSVSNVLAFDLFSAASFEKNPDTRLVLYVTAVEALACRNRRSEPVLSAVEQMSLMVDDLDVDDDMKRSLRSGLRELRLESIGQACRRLARTLGARTYGGDSAEKFFARCYTLRSRLVHGAVPRPDIDEVRVCGGNLQRLVGDLLAGAEMRTLVEDFKPPARERG